MKKVTLVKFSSGNMMVEDVMQKVEIRERTAFNCIPNTTEQIINAEIEVDACDIHRIVDQDREYYIAADRKVWEYLYLIENPVTAETQRELITRQYIAISKLRIDKNICTNKLIRINNYTFWERLKFIFRGANI
ncbi:MAG: hypothetical protein GY810_28405 [Aureispira sp.]|nr:hypothetical protein [Aureispira sp.]